MILVVALVDLAKKVSEVIKGDVAYAVGVKGDVELRHKVYSHQPDILLLDWRIGGSRYRATDQVPLIMERTASQPYTVMLLPHRSRAIDREAARLGCYNVVSTTGKKFPAELAAVVAAARAARKAGLPAIRRAVPVLH